VAVSQSLVGAVSVGKFIAIPQNHYLYLRKLIRGGKWGKEEGRGVIKRCGNERSGKVKKDHRMGI